MLISNYDMCFILPLNVRYTEVFSMQSKGRVRFDLAIRFPFFPSPTRSYQNCNWCPWATNTNYIAIFYLKRLRTLYMAVLESTVLSLWIKLKLAFRDVTSNSVFGGTILRSRHSVGTTSKIAFVNTLQSNHTRRSWKCLKIIQCFYSTLSQCLDAWMTRGKKTFDY